MAHENRSMRLTGDLFAFRIVNGVEQKGLGPLNADVLSFQSSAEVVKVADKRRGRRGQNMKVFTDPAAPTGKLKLYSVPTRILAMLMLGSVVSRNDAGGTVASEDVAVEPDFWTPLAHRNVSALVLTDGADVDPVTYVLDKDYELDDKLGLIRPIEGGAITSAATLEAAYTYKAVTGERIEVSTDYTVRARLLLRGTNDSDDSAVEWEAYQALATPDGEFDLLSAEPVTAEFSLEFETPDGQDHPIRLDFPVYAA